MNIKNYINKLLSSGRIFLILAVSLCVGVLLIVLPKQNKVINRNETVEHQSSDTKIVNDYTDYERELKRILSKVKGVGEVDVMIKYSSTERRVLEKDIDTHGNEKTVLKSETSKSEPFVVATEFPTVDGIIIVAKGGGSASVKTSITDCVAGTMGVPAYKVKVLEMK